ncbi:F0F1 ATP synthase subunit A [Oleiharenicola lentus]|uniref:F0F1 ATP synthase subunit A n=1 Tax=Oleiharenicola lentus TaxID=2508720 RepID=UPI003F6621B9
MFTTKKLLGLAAGLGLATSAFAEGVAARASVLIPLGHDKHGVWGITNSMLTSWTISTLVVLLILWAVGKPKIFPTKSQAVFESILEALRELFEPIVGKKAFPAAFPLLVTLFIFILVHNWMGLLPGVGTFGWGHTDAAGHFHLTNPWIRPHNADFNGTIALALVSFGAWIILILKYAGPKLILWDLFGNKAEKSETPGWLYPILSLVFIIVGLIEVFSIGIRPFTLSVRLFGNVFGGENLLHGTSFFFVFYFMELLVGLIQATVFTLLSAVYLGLITNHGDDHDHAEGHGAGHGAEAHH